MARAADLLTPRTPIPQAAQASLQHVRDAPKNATNGNDKEAPVETRRDAKGMTTCKESFTVSTDDPILENSGLAEEHTHRDQRRRKGKASPRANNNSPPNRLQQQDNNKDKPSRKCSRKPSTELPHPRRFSSQEHLCSRQHRHTAPNNRRHLPRKVSRYRHLPYKFINDQSDHSSNPGSAETTRTEKEQPQGDPVTFGQRENARNHAHDAGSIANSHQKKNNSDGNGKRDAEAKEWIPTSHHLKELDRKNSAGAKTGDHQKGKAKDDSSGKAKGKRCPKDKR